MEDEKIESKDKGKPSILDKERTTNEELKKVIEERKALLEEAKRLRNEELLSGKADAGVPPVQPKEETPREYKDRIMRGGK